MDIFGYVKSKLNKFAQQVQQNAFKPTPQQQFFGNVGKYVGQQAQNFTQQAIPQVQSFAQPKIQQFQNTLNNTSRQINQFQIPTPKFQYQDFTSPANLASKGIQVGASNIAKIAKPYVANIPKNIANPQQAFQNAGKNLGVDRMDVLTKKMAQGQKLTPQEQKELIDVSQNIAWFGTGDIKVPEKAVPKVVGKFAQGEGELTAPVKMLTTHEKAPDKKQIEIYKKMIQKGEKIDPIKVIREGLQYGVEDGKHRLEAYKQLGITDIPIKVVGNRPPPLQQPQLRLTKSGKVKVDMREVKLPTTPKEDFIAQLERNQFQSKFPSQPKSPPPPDFTAGESANMGGGAEFKAQTDKKGFDKIFAKWIGARDVAKTTGTETAAPFTKSKVKGEDLIRHIENPQGTKNPELKEYSKAFRAQYDKLYKEAQDAGLDIGYIKDYVTHIWKGSPLEVQQAYNSAKQRFNFANERTFPTYKEGIKVGKWLESQGLPNPFVPKYSNPAQIMQEYTRRLNQTKANLNFFRELQQEGLVVPASVGRSQYGFKPINAPGFPHSSSTVEGVTVQGSYYAPGEIADQINKIFAPDIRNWAGKLVGKTGQLSSGIQDVTLSGGIKNVNAFTSAQALKEVLAGRPHRALQTYFSSWSPKSSMKYFQENAGQIKKMQSQNIAVSSSYDIEHMIPSSEIKRTLGEKLGNVWSKAVNEPTFKRFMPTLQIRYFNDIERQALKGGATAEEAVKIAGQATKNFYGLVGTEKQAVRSKVGQDAIRTFLFAPKYRESMVNFWVNNIKAFRHPLALENRGNMKFVAGATALYVAMNMANQQFNGRPMWENPPGKEDTLLIPLGNGTTIGVPFLSSIATVPRSIIKTAVHTAQGNLKQAGADLRTNLSMGIKPFADIAVNQNYFGQDIYDENDDAPTKWKKVGQYLARSYQHPYIAALMDKYTKNDPALVTVSKALELPFRFYKDKSLEAGYYYANRDKFTSQLNPKDKAIYDKLHSGTVVDDDGLPVYNKRSEMANALDRLANPSVLRAEAATAIETSRKTGQPLNPFYELAPKQQETILLLKTFYPGDKTKSTITKANIDWLQPYWDKRDQYVSYLKKQGVISENSNYPQAPRPNAQVQAKLDYYNTLPSGTGARSAFLRGNPDVLQYFTDSRNFTNAQRADLGLPLLENSTYASGGGGKKGKKISATSFKKAKVKKIKIAKAKKPKIKKIKLAKAKIKKYKPKKMKALS